MDRFDLKVLAIIGASALAGVAVTAALLSPSIETAAFDETAFPGSVAVLGLRSETKNLRHSELPPWWRGEAPIRFSGPGARGMGKKGMRSGFRLKDPPRRLGFQIHGDGTRILGFEIGTPDTWADYKLKVRPPAKN